VLGLLPEAEARRQLPVAENGIVIPASKGVSTSYEAATWGAVIFTNYVATWGVSGGKLVEDVLADRDGPLQATWSTPIRALTPRRSLTLDSSRDVTGQRTWTWYDRCPVFEETPWPSPTAPPPSARATVSPSTRRATCTPPWAPPRRQGA
jgi:hypothetical protein